MRDFRISEWAKGPYRGVGIARFIAIDSNSERLTSPGRLRSRKPEARPKKQRRYTRRSLLARWYWNIVGASAVSRPVRLWRTVFVLAIDLRLAEPDGERAFGRVEMARQIAHPLPAHILNPYFPSKRIDNIHVVQQTVERLVAAKIGYNARRKIRKETALPPRATAPHSRVRGVFHHI